MIKLLTRKKTDPSIELLKQNLRFAAVRLGRYYGAKQMLSEMYCVVSRLRNISHPARIIVDIQYMEEMTK